MFSKKAAQIVTAPVAAAAGLYLYNNWKLSSSTSSSSVAASLPLIRQQPILSSYRPSDKLHIHFSVQTYKESSKQDLPTNWEIAHAFESKENSYFGTAYKNEQSKHLIVAHRGTEDLKDWVSNVDLITRHLNGQEVNAWDDFAKKIVEEYGPEYQYSFTGHSLGGWLAQVCLWKYQDEFVKRQSLKYKDAFAVTLDDPGARELLDALQPRVEGAYKRDSDRLDITAYLSHPNIVNTGLGHVGTTYALSPELNLSAIQYQTPIHTLKSHSAPTLLNEFKDDGLPRFCVRVIDWPKVMWGSPLPSANHSKGVLGYLVHVIKAYVKGDIERGEYTGFYSYKAEDIANPLELSTAARFQLKHGIHYNVQAFDGQVLPLRNMPSAARQFLEDLSLYPDRVKALKPLVSEEPKAQFLSSLQAYRVNGNQELVLDKSTGYTARNFRDELLGFLNANPILSQSKLTVLREEYTARRLSAIELGTLQGVMADFREQTQQTQSLVSRISFKQGTARLYKFIKPTFDEIDSIETEYQAVKSQLTTLQSLRLNLQAQKLDTETQTELKEVLEQQRQQLELAEQSISALLSYMKGTCPEADNLTSTLTETINKTSLSPADKGRLLNRAYNLKAKIATSLGDKNEAIKHYEEAIKLLPEDALTLSNYAGLLTDMGRIARNADFHLKAYGYYQKVYPRLDQIKSEQKLIVSSGMAYGLILLAQSIEQKQIEPSKVNVPTAKELRSQARNLLQQATNINPNYINGRLFQAILTYDEGNYLASLQEINQVLTLQPVHPTALMRKGVILEKLGQVDDALNFLGQAKNILVKNQKKSENDNWIKEIDEKILNIEKNKTKKCRL